MVFLKLVHTQYQVNHKTQPFWVKVVHLVPNVHTLAGYAVGTNNYPPFRHSTQNQVLIPALDFLSIASWKVVVGANSCWCQMDGTNCMPSQRVHIGLMGYVIYLVLPMHQFQKYHLLREFNINSQSIVPPLRSSLIYDHNVWFMSQTYFVEQSSLSAYRKKASLQKQPAHHLERLE